MALRQLFEQPVTECTFCLPFVGHGWRWQGASDIAPRRWLFVPGSPTRILLAALLLQYPQAGAEVLVQPTAAVAREVFWELADVLLAPCSLFDAADTLLLHRSMIELANSNTEQAAAMQAAFFTSSKVGWVGECEGW